jgi:hypothetical protein
MQDLESGKSKPPRTSNTKVIQTPESTELTKSQNQPKDEPNIILQLPIEQEQEPISSIDTISEITSRNEHQKALTFSNNPTPSNTFVSNSVQSSSSLMTNFGYDDFRKMYVSEFKIYDNTLMK